MKFGKSEFAPGAIVDDSDTQNIGPLHLDGKFFVPAHGMRLAAIKHKGGNLPILQMHIDNAGIYAPLSVDQIDNLITTLGLVKQDLMKNVAGEATTALKKAAGK